MGVESIPGASIVYPGTLSPKNQLEYAQNRLQEAEFWDRDPTGMNWTSWGRLMAHEEELKAKINLALVSASVNHTPVDPKVIEWQDEIGRGRLNQISQTIGHLPGTVNYYMFRQRDDNLFAKDRLEKQIDSIRGNDNSGTQFAGTTNPFNVDGFLKQFYKDIGQNPNNIKPKWDYSKVS